METLAVALYVTDESKDPDPAHISPAIFWWRYALRLIASAPLSSLKTITIGIDGMLYQERRLVDGCTLGLVNWRKWDEVLGRFENLEQVRFAKYPIREDASLPMQPLSEETRDYVAEALPSLNSRGILRFS